MNNGERAALNWAALFFIILKRIRDSVIDKKKTPLS